MGNFTKIALLHGCSPITATFAVYLQKTFSEEHLWGIAFGFSEKVVKKEKI